jgi:hypothetical protein
MADPNLLFDLNELSIGDPSTNPFLVPDAGAPSSSSATTVAPNTNFFSSTFGASPPTAASASNTILRLLDSDSDDEGPHAPQAQYSAPSQPQIPAVQTQVTPVSSAPQSQAASPQQPHPEAAPQPAFSALHNFVNPNAPTGVVLNSASTSPAPEKGQMSVDAAAAAAAAATQPAPTSQTPPPASTTPPVSSTTQVSTPQPEAPPQHEGDMERKSSGWLGEFWEPIYVRLKEGRLAVYTIKDGRRDIHPSQHVYLIEANISVSADQTTISIVHERKGINWTVRCPLGIQYMKQWISMIAQHLKWYKALNTSNDTTIMEYILVLGITRKSMRTKEQYRSFPYYMSKPSTGYFAIAAALMIELYVRKLIEISEKGVLSVKEAKRRTGIALLDECIHILRHKLKKENPQLTVVDFLKYLSMQPAGDIYALQVAPLRVIDLALNRGLITRLGKKEYLIQDTRTEDHLIRILRCEEPANKENVREHDTLAIAYTMLKIASKDFYYNQDVREP